MKVRVHVLPKAGALDPQGEAVCHALKSMGFDGVNDVRQGKIIELDVSEETTRELVVQMCERLLANSVVESYEIESPLS
ncbi:MAG: phosphoribosylformylglycinamidine synthase subunit PurS [Aestuariivita sp.]|nr:phosphoribosylformylglycinamidine synthase subunit PurS [Aestuariivita sp.]MCY4201100.1 phosphoribosylformylglycinamidine synthase subunit PurS [Aestuariivita sp.]MCY4288287.1 phosphoribosylformylglycinamidine synthase subunit PurS [Aestuariivita sp.]MCY4345931.1 phosphoribosylformylglycinamidine synthase subunit PurS [Aestuariivita sp.]